MLKNIILTLLLVTGLRCLGQDIHAVGTVVLPPLNKGTYTVPSSSTVNVTSSERIFLRPGASLKPGSTVSLKIANPPGMTINPVLRSYIRTDYIKIEGITDSTRIDTMGIGRRQTAFTYIDGFGRPVQTVAMQASPAQHDMVQNQVYDNTGRQTIGYLPYTDTAANGIFRPNATFEQAAFYQAAGDKIADDSAPYSQQVFENSPLQRLLTAGSAGVGFQPGQHDQNMVYRSNLSTENVINWGYDGVKVGTYADAKLSVTEATDSEGKKMLVYTDLAGNTLLKRQLSNETVGGISVTWFDTYYIYNTAGKISYVVPPKAVQAMLSSSNYDLTQTAVAKLLFHYTYNSLGQVVTKQVPSAGEVYMVYDPLDRPVLVQDANLRAQHQWNYIKYDAKGRAISQGIYTDNTHISLSSMQGYVSGLDYSSVYFEARNSSAPDHYYTNSVFPTAGIDPLAYAYFDNYDIDNNGAADYAYVNQGLNHESAATSLTNGMPTATLKRTVGSGLSNNWLMAVMFYNKRGQAIQTQSNNQLNAAVNDKTIIVPDFTGKTLQVKTVKYDAANHTTVLSTYAYDHADRIKTVDQNYNGGSTLRVGSYTYNELGQLIDKKLHSTNTGFTAYLQSVDYRYNIRSQLLSINNSTLTNDGDKNDDSNDVFGMELLYNQTDAGIGNTASYTGNISAVKWMSKNVAGVNGAERSYKYDYDLLNRLKNGRYADRSGAGAWANIGAYDEKNISYDENGNILALKRNALISGSIARIDSLIYSYDGNRLSNVTDGTTANFTGYGFKNLTASVSTTPYAYNDNGSLTVDLKKGITSHYNVLNRVDTVKITTGTNKFLTYTYDAAGSLIRKRQYNNATLQKTTDYIDGFVFEDGNLSYFAMPEGRVRDSSGIFTNEYIITDQQGNARVSFQDNGSGTAKVRQENSYYAFGLMMTNGITPTTQPNKNLYNGGSEWQNDFVDLPDLYQTFFRNYDPALGRWTGVDPQPESAESMSVYQYAGNNPVMGNDPMGDLTKLQQAEAILNDNNVKFGGRISADGTFKPFTSFDEAFYSGAADMTAGGSWGASDEAGVSFAPNYQLAAAWANIHANANIDGYAPIKEVDQNPYLGTLINQVDVVYGDQNSYDIASLEIWRQITTGANQGGGVGQPGTLESFIPVWGEGRAGVDDIQNGRYWSGAFHIALAVSDVFLVESIAKGIGKGAWKLGSHSWSATRKWMVNKGYAGAGEPLHHWAITQATAKKYALEAISNQPWNLVKFSEQSMHIRAGHGLNYLGQPGYGMLGQFLYGTPTWFKAGIVSGGGRIGN